MAKPIFIIKLPWSIGESGRVAASNEFKALQKEYFVLIVMSNIEEVEFEAFYEKDFTHIKFKELKELIKNIKGDERKSNRTKRDS